MAHFAKLGEDNIVLEVLVINNSDNADPQTLVEDEALGVAFLQKITGHATWKQCSYNNNFRKQFAGVGMTYNSELDMFISPKPFPSWTLNTDTLVWEPPTAEPTLTEEQRNVGSFYYWNEETRSWVFEDMTPPAEDE